MFLDVEDAIVDRLNERLAGTAVLTAEELSDINERQQVTPAVHVIYSGYRPTREVGDGIVQEIETQWTVVIAVRSARRGGVREKAAPVMREVIKALAGWRPDKSHSTLKLASAPSAAHNPGFSYYPVQFTTRESVRGT
jgi:hypothetical protein